MALLQQEFNKIPSEASAKKNAFAHALISMGAREYSTSEEQKPLLGLQQYVQLDHRRGMLQAIQRACIRPDGSFTPRFETTHIANYVSKHQEELVMCGVLTPKPWTTRVWEALQPSRKFSD